MDPSKIVTGFRRDKSDLLPLLHALQDSHPQNYLTGESLKAAARHLSINLSWVYGVAGYYSMFSLEPRGRYIVRICNSPVCNLLGSEAMLETIESLLGVHTGETTPDGLFTIEESECLGICEVAPAMMINRDVYGNLTPERIAGILNDIRNRQKQQK
ncbi:MAG: NAD(P)H-dependent oxidoreductase subunit E [Bacteroidales bacterium]